MSNISNESAFACSHAVLLRSRQMTYICSAYQARLSVVRSSRIQRRAVVTRPGCYKPKRGEFSWIKNGAKYLLLKCFDECVLQKHSPDELVSHCKVLDT